MIIGDRLREVRKLKRLSQGDIEKRTGLWRCHISRVENGYIVPSIETLEKLALACAVPLYELFYDGEKPPKLLDNAKDRTREAEWGSTGKDARFLRKLQECLRKMGARDRQLLFGFAYQVRLRYRRQS